MSEAERIFAAITSVSRSAQADIYPTMNAGLRVLMCWPRRGVCAMSLPAKIADHPTLKRLVLGEDIDHWPLHRREDLKALLASVTLGDLRAARTLAQKLREALD